MVKYSSGTFRMGSTATEAFAAYTLCVREPLGHRCRANLFETEGPRRTIRLSSFWLDRREVTVAEYERCVAARRCNAIPYHLGGARFDQPTFPVSLVTWDEANAYCKFRGHRLPTEAEFERAARGRSGRTFPWGDIYNSHASNHGRLGWQRFDRVDGYAELAPVGSFSAGETPEGVADLAGNVAEWVQDRYLPGYDPQDATDPEGPPPGPAGNRRAVRGGSYESSAPWLRGASRDYEDRDTRRPTVGFRCAHSDAAGAR